MNSRPFIKCFSGCSDASEPWKVVWHLSGKLSYHLRLLTLLILVVERHLHGLLNTAGQGQLNLCLGAEQILTS
jgi:hypothetical protein